ncbi:MAG: hypothetical protein C0497_11040 [Gemmatimonas sp.]|nr:hypothetical protein [Gemmatimonas sp.]
MPRWPPRSTAACGATRPPSTGRRRAPRGQCRRPAPSRMSCPFPRPWRSARMRRPSRADRRASTSCAGSRHPR